MAPGHWFFLNLLCFCIFGPIVTIILSLLYIYRRIVEVLLRIQLKDSFAGLLEGTDCVWAIEEPTARSVINVLVLLEKDQHQVGSNFPETFRNLVKERMMRSPYKKLLYRRSAKYGYFFWEKPSEIDLANRVRWLGHDPTSCDGHCDDARGEALRKVVQNETNKPLPEDHSASWEILIGRCCSRSTCLRLRRMQGEGKLSKDRARKTKMTVPVLFRVHHSVGDGVALIKLLVESLADAEIVRESFVKIEGEAYKVTDRCEFKEISVPVPRWRTGERTAETDAEVHDDRSMDAEIVVSASMPFAYFVTLRIAGKSVRDLVDFWMKCCRVFTTDAVQGSVKTCLTRTSTYFRDVVCERIREAAEMLAIMMSVPRFFVQQAVDSMDNSALHGPNLKGEKLVAYWMESDIRNSSDVNLLTKIHDIKNITGARFADVILAAVSSSLHKYFLRIDEAAPNRLNVVLPSRMSAPSRNAKLQNDFSVGLLPLCISVADSQHPTSNGDIKILDRLYDVVTSHDKLQNGPDYLINYWVMKYLCAVLPDKLLRPILESHCTMVFSNLPGPKELRILGHPLKNIVFWIPNRSTTGIGCSAFSYGGKMHFSLIADIAVMKDEQHLADVLQDTVREIESLHESLMASSFSRKLHCPVKAATGKNMGDAVK